MGITDKEKHIKNLSYIMDSMPDDACGDWRDSLAYAISSLKTDEVYQLMYKGEEIFTKADMAAILEELKNEIFKESWRLECLCDDLDGSVVDLDDINKIIQQKIDKLRESEL